MRPGRAIALLGAAYALAGCGATQSDQVQAKLQQFAHAVASRNTPTLCQQVLAPTLVARLTAIGISCPQAMKSFVDEVRDPTVAVSHVKIDGKRASAIVRAGAKGQRSVTEPISLTLTAHGWRLASLVSAR